MEIIYKPIDELIPYINNPRKNDGKAVDKVAASIKEFGFKVPIIVDKDNVIVTGHTRYKASKKLKLKEVPTITADDLTDAQIKAFRIADNRVSEESEWDFEKLEIELEGLNIDLSILGFEDNELKFLDDKEVIEDDFDEEPPEVPQSKLGDIWTLGKHRLMCGDSTSESEVKTLVNNNPIFLIQTDPPYGMNAVSKSGVLSKTYGTDIKGDNDNTVAIKSFELCQRLYSTANQVWWGANYYTDCIPSSECWIVWDKNNGQSDQTDCELAWANFRSVVRQFTLSSEKTNRVHPTQKPVKLFEWIIERFDKQKTFKTVLDLFGGSGSTLIGAEQLNISSFIMELDEKYIDVIVRRYAKFKQSTDDIKLLREGKEYTYEQIFI